MIIKYDTIRIPKESPLLQICDPVTDFNSAETKRIIEEMTKEISKDDRSLGLAANQLGYDKRIILMKNPNELGYLVMINPLLTWTSKDFEYFEEGCLSFPGLYVNIKRPDTVTVLYQDERAGQLSLTLEKLYARIIQHEIDHLDGILFFKHATRYHMEQSLKRWKKQKNY